MATTVIGRDLKGCSAANEPGKGVSVGTDGTTLALAANTDRVSADFVNDSDEVIYLRKASPAALNVGIRLNAAGGSYSIDSNNMYTGAIYAICASGSKVLCVNEN